MMIGRRSAALGAWLVLWVAGCGAEDTGARDPDAGADVDAASQPDASDAGIDFGADTALDGWIDGCPHEMARIDAFCVDRYEATLVEIGPSGAETPHSPYLVLEPTLKVRALSVANVPPQAYISQIQAGDACANAGKRLCSEAEFSLACRGPDPNDHYPYGGQQHLDDYCNEGKGSSMPLFFGNDPTQWTYDDFNDPKLNQWDGGLAKTGEFTKCVSPYGVHDCVGNLHEWGSDPADVKGHGRFRGGFYGDAEYNGSGCLYVTSAHELAYHDYSTGFRCCKDAVR